ncbi:hypothetical protein ES703_115290 [subsurface metagenome]
MQKSISALIKASKSGPAISGKSFLSLSNASRAALVWPVLTSFLVSAAASRNLSLPSAETAFQSCPFSKRQISAETVDEAAKTANITSAINRILYFGISQTHHCFRSSIVSPQPSIILVPEAIANLHFKI